MNTINKGLYIIFIRLTILLIVAGTGVGCRKLVEVDGPSTGISSANVYDDDVTATAVLTGLYIKLSTSGMLSGLTSITYLSGLSADELELYSGSVNTAHMAYYHNSLTPANSPYNSFWNAVYPLLYTTNAAIGGLTGNARLKPSVDKQLLGEASFMRAFFYFYLVNLYGDVPLITGTDYQTNSTPPRTPKAQVYEQIIKDLKDAQQSLSDQFVNPLMSPTDERVRPTRWAATALLARVYLYTGDWANAEKESSDLIAHPDLFQLDPLDDVFLKNSSEAIWQLQPVVPGRNTLEANFFVLPPTGPGGNASAYCSPFLLSSFETGDQRRVKWIDSVIVTVGNIPKTYYYPYKYKVWEYNSPVTEYEMVFRLGEQFLIRAEARAQAGDIDGGREDLDMIRDRAGLSGSSASTKEALLQEILHERQVELFTEWGSRWLDLKRTGKVDEVMNVITPQKGGTWKSTQQLYPVPLDEVLRNPNIEQNPGY